MNKLFVHGTEIIKQLMDADYEAYMVGGCVRDMILNHLVKDIDIVTNATPDQIKEVFEGEHILNIGEKFGILVLVRNHIHFEIATYRTDGNYSDGRRPDSVTFSSIEEDAKRRDFTMNAIYYNPITGEIKDFFNGIDDIDEGLIRAIGDPGKRFQEDYLRMLRAIRFSVQKDFNIELNTFFNIYEHAHHIESISIERINAELSKILLSDSPDKGIKQLKILRLLEFILPEVNRLDEVDQNPEYHPEGDVFKHTLNALKKSPKNLLVRMALLLHDIGKYYCTVVEDGKIKSPYHEEKSYKMAIDILKRLRIDNETTENVLWLIRHHGIFMHWDQFNQCKKYTFMVHLLFDNLVAHYKADRFSSNDLNIQMNTVVFLGKLEMEIERMIKDERRMLQAIKFNLITGADITPYITGKEVGIILSHIREDYLNGIFDTREEGLKRMMDNYVYPIFRRNIQFGGNDLIKMGYEPGPIFRSILDAIFVAVINKDIENDNATIIEFVNKTFTKGD